MSTEQETIETSKVTPPEKCVDCGEDIRYSGGYGEKEDRCYRCYRNYEQAQREAVRKANWEASQERDADLTGSILIQNVVAQDDYDKSDESVGKPTDRVVLLEYSPNWYGGCQMLVAVFKRGYGVKIQHLGRDGENGMSSLSPKALKQLHLATSAWFAAIGEDVPTSSPDSYGEDADDYDDNDEE